MSISPLNARFRSQLEAYASAHQLLDDLEECRHPASNTWKHQGIAGVAQLTCWELEPLIAEAAGIYSDALDELVLQLSGAQRLTADALARELESGRWSGSRGHLSKIDGGGA